MSSKLDEQLNRMRLASVALGEVCRCATGKELNAKYEGSPGVAFYPPDIDNFTAVLSSLLAVATATSELRIAVEKEAEAIQARLKLASKN